MSELTPTAKVTYTLYDHQLNIFSFFIILRVVFSIRYEVKKKKHFLKIGFCLSFLQILKYNVFWQTYIQNVNSLFEKHKNHR